MFMKKLRLSFALLFVTITAFGQVLKPVKIDSLVTVSLPTNHQKKDTLGQHIYSGNGLVGFMEVIKAPNVKNTAPLNKENDLNNVFKEYIKTIQIQSTNGSTQNIRDTIIGTLKAKLFTLSKEDENSTIQLRNFVLIYTTEATYTFEYAYPEFRKYLITDEYKAYVNSIKFSRDLQRDDQYLFKTKSMSSTTKIGLYGGAGLIITAILIFIARKKKRQHSKKNKSGAK
jgi:hypothetical protein